MIHHDDEHNHGASDRDDDRAPTDPRHRTVQELLERLADRELARAAERRAAEKRERAAEGHGADDDDDDDDAGVPAYPPATLQLGLPGHQLDAFPASVLERVDAHLVAEQIRIRDDRELAEREEEQAEEEERQLVVDLQRAFDFESNDYMPPAAHLLLGRRPGSRRRRHEHDPSGLASLSDAQLANRMPYVWLHRSRRPAGEGLCANDQAVQDEWLNRAAAFGHVRKLVALNNVTLPVRYVEHVHVNGRTSTARERVVRLLMLCDAFGWNGFTVSEHQAEDAGICSRAQWWRAVAQLEAWGLLVHVRTYKCGLPPDPESGSSGRTVGLCRNWYGPGPELAKLRRVYLAELGRGDVADLDAFDLDVERKRKAKAWERRRKRTGDDAAEQVELPDWHGALLDEMRAAECFELGHLGVEPGDVLDERRTAQLEDALVAEGLPGATSTGELVGDVVASAGGGDASPASSGVPAHTALSSRERPTVRKLEFKLEGRPDGAGEASPPPADATTSPTSSPVDVAPGRAGEPEPACCKATPCAAGEPARCNHGHSPDQATSRPAGGQGPKARTGPTQPDDPIDTFERTLSLFATVDALAASIADATSESPPRENAARSAVLLATTGVRCPWCGCSSFDVEPGGLARCSDCRTLVVLE